MTILTGTQVDERGRVENRAHDIRPALTKLREKIEWEGNRLTKIRTYDLAPTLRNVRLARDGIGAKFGQAEKVATIPGWLIEMWCKEDRVPFHDSEARLDVIRRRMMSGEYSKLTTTDKKW